MLYALTHIYQPKYWCKHCKTFVRDTKLEKANHDATPKHQGNIKRFLRDLHRGHERDEREKQRAKDEVNRLNGVVSGSGTGSGQVEAQNTGAPWRRKPAIRPPTMAITRHATLAERRQQVARLAEMGVAVPEEFRREMAMAGDWQVVSERPLYGPGIKGEKEEGGGEEQKYSNGLNIGVRKRKYGGQEEDDEVAEMGARRAWGSMIHTYPDPRTQNGQEDLDSLLGKTKLNRLREDLDNDHTSGGGGSASSQTPAINVPQPGIDGASSNESPTSISPIKQEDTDETKPVSYLDGLKPLKEDPDGPEQQPAVVFKKRKAKPIRHK